ncbi:SigE family RNA polymerase sigma factor [Luteococcus peritonei]|uniref:SigE family RNA polymerase sigma factor n=1 Tax=Luteococcus peritonei TaxID=88874 RepID=A0ABW4RYK3_9ACTN
MFGRSKAQRDEEFSRFVAEARDSLAGTAWLLTGDREQAADLVQAALVKTYAAWPRVRGGEASGYARRALVNENIDRWRKARPELLVAEVDDPAVADQTEQVDRRDELVRALADLPVQQRTVVVLRYFDDLSERQVAEQLGISVGAVKSAASRGLARLRAGHPEGALS